MSLLISKKKTEFVSFCASRRCVTGLPNANGYASSLLVRSALNSLWQWYVTSSRLHDCQTPLRPVIRAVAVFRVYSAVQLPLLCPPNWRKASSIAWIICSATASWIRWCRLHDAPCMIRCIAHDIHVVLMLVRSTSQLRACMHMSYTLLRQSS